MSNGANFTCSGSSISVEFDKISIPVIVTISVVSILLNIFNILIFSKKKMVSPTNSILLGIALSDLIKMFLFLVTSVVPVTRMSHSYDYQVFFLFCNVAMYLMHAFALWCGVLLALFRFFYLRYYASARTKVWFSLRRARLALWLAFLANLIAVVPYAGSLQILDVGNATDAAAGPPQYVPSLNKRHEFKIRLFNGLAQKVLPCLIMACLCFFIIKSLRQTEKRRESLVNLNSRSRMSRGGGGGGGGGCESFVTNNSDAEAAGSAPPPPPCKRSSRASRRERRSRDHRRTTSFLLVIIVLYILYEIPMSLLNILEDPMLQLVSVQCFFNKYISILNTLGLINNSVNFVLYCFMSKQFRQVFKEMFALARFLHPKNTSAAAAAASSAATAGASTAAGAAADAAATGGSSAPTGRRQRRANSSSRSGGRKSGSSSSAAMLTAGSASLRSHEDERSCFSVSEAPSNAYCDC